MVSVGRRGGAPKRTKMQVARDRYLVTQWTALGYSLKEMEAKLQAVTRPEE